MAPGSRIRVAGEVRDVMLAVLQADLINGAKLLGWVGNRCVWKPDLHGRRGYVPGETPCKTSGVLQTCQLCDEGWRCLQEIGIKRTGH